MGGSLETIVLETVSGDVAFQMALHEAILNSDLPKNSIVVRLIEFSQPGITLGRRQSLMDVKPNGLGITRRESAGSAMLCNDKQIYFAVFGPRTTKFNRTTEVHSVFGERIAGLLRDYGISRAKSSEHYYVKVDGKAIAGSAQHWAGDVWVYEGVLTVEPWDLTELQNLLHLRPGEAEWIVGLPAIGQTHKISRKSIMFDLLSALSGLAHVQHTALPKQILEVVKNLYDTKYNNQEWVYNPGKELEKNMLGFCLCGDLGKT